MIVEDGQPGPAIIGRLEYAAIDLRHVEEVWLRRDAGYGAGSAAAERSDIAPPQQRMEIGIAERRANRGKIRHEVERSNEQSRCWHLRERSFKREAKVAKWFSK